MIFPDIHPFFINVGVILLFFPPIIFSSSEWIIKKYERYLGMNMLVLGSFLGLILMIVLVPEAYMAFCIYTILFLGSIRFIEKLGQNRTDAFLLSVYLCFSVAVLWEWPIQLAVQLPHEEVYYQGQILSLFKAVAIPLFLLRCRKLGWKPKIKVLRYLIIILLVGIDLTVLLHLYGATSYIFWLSHLYRVPYIILLLSFIPKNLYIPIKKDDNILRS